MIAENMKRPLPRTCNLAVTYSPKIPFTFASNTSSDRCFSIGTNVSASTPTGVRMGELASSITRRIASATGSGSGPSLIFFATTGMSFAASAAYGDAGETVAGFATNPFELFLDYGMRIKGRSPALQTFVLQLTTPWCGYLPTERAVALTLVGALLLGLGIRLVRDRTGDAPVRLLGRRRRIRGEELNAPPRIRRG